MVNIIKMNNPAASEGRLSREAWLRKALDALAEADLAIINIEKLAFALGVSRGSFYWHFENRDDFVRALLAYWHEEYTVAVIESVSEAGGSGQEKFRKLFRGVYENDLAKYDVPIRMWAMRDPKIAELVRATDIFRLNFMKSVLADCGFSGHNLDVRAHSCIAYMAMDKGMFDSAGWISSDEDFEDVYKFFIGNN